MLQKQWYFFQINIQKNAFNGMILSRKLLKNILDTRIVSNLVNSLEHNASGWSDINFFKWNSQSCLENVKVMAALEK